MNTTDKDADAKTKGWQSEEQRQKFLALMKELSENCKQLAKLLLKKAK